MQTREKRLAIVLAAVVGAMGFWTIIKPWYFGPIDEAQAQLGLVQSELDRLEDQQLQLLGATRQLADWKAESLPPDPKPRGRQRPDALNGQRLYQEWLTDLARHCGFQNPEVTPSITRAVQDVYVTVQVRLQGEATYDQLCQFLSMFEQTELLHRIDSCQIESANHIGNPVLDINLVAEGVALQNAPQRDALFPTTELVSPLKPTATKLTVKSPGGFPEQGRFGIRIGEEQITVTAVKGNDWQISRGQDQTKPAAHTSGAAIDLGLYNALTANEAARKMHPRLEMITAQNPFTIPAPKGDYNPYLNLPAEQLVYLGSRLDVPVRAEGFNPSGGPPKFEFAGEVPKGMQLEASPDQPFQSRITWAPEEESQIDTYTVSVQAMRGDLAKPLVQSVRVTVREPNAAPRLAAVEKQVVYSGQPLTFTVSATDENENQRLTYSLGANAPPEATIDPSTGAFAWTPPGVVMEQSLNVEIAVTDDGNPAERASIQVPVEVKPDVAHFTRFVGSLADSNANEAWLFDRWNNQDLVIREGETLTVADISARLVEVQSNQLVFERNKQTWALELGHDVRDMKPMETNKTTAQN